MRLSLLAFLVAAVTAASAQSPAPRSFDVASVRMNRSGQPFGMPPVLQPGGSVRAINVILLDLIRAAYGLEENQIVSASPVPDVFFDIDARTGPTTTAAEAVVMLRTLLAERFGFAAHPETRQLPVYTLVRASRTALGPALKPAGTECAPVKFPGGGAGPLPPPPPPPPGASGTPISARSAPPPRCPTAFFPGGISARAIDMPAFASALALFVHRPVIDRTDLAGEFDLDMYYAPDFALGPETAPPTSTAPSLVTALREQLGLRLDAGRAAVDVLVIDRLQLPTEN